MEETRLVERARKGDADAFAALVKAHQSSLYASAYALLGNGWDAGDAVQAALQRGWAGIAKLRDAGRFKAWLSRILVNECNETFRKRRRLVLVEEPDEGEACVYTGREDGIDLMDALRSLDQEQRQVVALRYFRDLKVEEIAALLGCPEGTVKSRLSRALDRLSRLLDEDMAKEAAR